MRSNIWSNIWINDYKCVNNKKLSRKYSRLFYKLGIVLSHCALFIIMTLSMRFIRAKSDENISSPDISQEMFIYRQLHARSRYILYTDFQQQFAHSYMRDTILMFNECIWRSVLDNDWKLLWFLSHHEVSIA